MPRRRANPHRIADGGELCAESQLAVQRSDIAELEINPLFAMSEGAYAGDALLVIK